MNPRRLKTLIETGLLDTPAEESFDRLTRLAAQTLRSPASLVSLVDRDRLFFKSQYGLDQPWAHIKPAPLLYSFCKHVVEAGEPFIITDAQEDLRVSKDLQHFDSGVIAYLGIPLQMKNQETIGSLCVLDSKPRNWSQTDVDIMKELTVAVINVIELRMLLISRNEIREVMIHDIKNHIGAIILGCGLIEKKLSISSSPFNLTIPLAKIKKAGLQIQNMIEGFQDLIEIESNEFLLVKSKENVDSLIKSVIHQFEKIRKGQTIDVNLSLNCDQVLECDSQRIGKVISYLIGFLVDSAQVQSIFIHTSTNEQTIVIQIKASQLVLDQKVSDQLFCRVGCDNTLPKKGQRLSLYLAQQYVFLHKGEISVESHPTSGTEFLIHFPLPIEKEDIYPLKIA